MIFWVVPKGKISYIYRDVRRIFYKYFDELQIEKYVEKYERKIILKISESLTVKN